MGKQYNFESERLKTRQLVEEDAVNLFQIYSDKEAMKYRGSKPMESIEEGHKMITEQFIENNCTVKVRLAVIKKSNNCLIGTLLLLVDKQVNHSCEIGFSFGKKYWGNGYGTETLTMVTDKLTTIENSKEIKAWCIKENIASIRIFEKAGFSKRKQNKYPNSNLFVKKLSS